MALFDVPGWSVPAEPAQVVGKRKRPSGRVKVAVPEVNLDQLVKKLKVSGSKADANGTWSVGEGKTKRKKRVGHTKSGGDEGRQRAKDSTLLKPHVSGSATEDGRKRQRISSSSAPKATSKSPVDDETTKRLTAMQKGMKHSLDGARFRWINELFYKTSSEEALQMVKDDPKIYAEYHTGFRHQVKSWPTNPVSHYISSFSTLPPKTIIADLGCGDAALARALLPKGLTVMSFDLISDGSYVVEADICAHVPLPGSESVAGERGEGEGAVVDVVVCALSLMGTNWVHCIREAWRILKPGGLLYIAEVASRFRDPNEFAALVSEVGFRAKSKDDKNTHFMLWEFQKVSRKGKSQKEWAKLLERGVVLKPCEYKRR